MQGFSGIASGLVTKTLSDIVRKNTNDTAAAIADPNYGGGSDAPVMVGGQLRSTAAQVNKAVDWQNQQSQRKRMGASYGTTMLAGSPNVGTNLLLGS